MTTHLNSFFADCLYIDNWYYLVLCVSTFGLYHFCISSRCQGNPDVSGTYTGHTSRKPLTSAGTYLVGYLTSATPQDLPQVSPPEAPSLLLSSSEHLPLLQCTLKHLTPLSGISEHLPLLQSISKHLPLLWSISEHLTLFRSTFGAHHHCSLHFSFFPFFTLSPIWLPYHMHTCLAIPFFSHDLHMSTPSQTLQVP